MCIAVHEFRKEIESFEQKLKRSFSQTGSPFYQYYI